MDEDDDWLCMDCGKDVKASGEYFMLDDALWRRVNPLVIGMLCLGCTEDRLGRPLYGSDFSSASCNVEHAQTCPDLAQRMARDATQESLALPFPAEDFKAGLRVRLAKKAPMQSELGRQSAALLIGDQDPGPLPEVMALLIRSGWLTRKRS